MRIKEDVNLVQFIQEVKKCRNDVYLETDEGDRLNLKSTLSQYIFVCVGSSTAIRSGNVTCSDPADIACLADYLTEE